MEQLKKFLQSIHPVKEEILDEYLAAWEIYEVPRKTLITREGQVQRHIYFVLEGVQKSYYLHNGKEHVIAFTYPPSFSGIPESFLTQTPSRYYLESITKSKFIRLSYEKQQMFITKYRSIETSVRKATEALLIGALQRNYELMAYDIETRFRVFMQRSAHLLHLVSQKDLASYLRINATNFSKLMGKVKI